MGVASNLTKFEALGSVVAATTAGVVSCAGKSKCSEAHFAGESFSESTSAVSNSFTVDVALEQMMKNEVMINSKFGDSTVSNTTNFYSVMK